MNALSIVLSGLLALICMAGTFSHHYRENWLQFAGLVTVAIWATMRAYHALQGAAVNGPELLLEGGALLFSFGTAWKVWRHSARGGEGS